MDAAGGARSLTGGKISRRLIILIIAFSSVITLLLSVAELAAEYQELKGDVDRELSGIALQVPTLANSVWAFDDRQIQLGLDALVELPSVEHATVEAADSHQRWTSGRVHGDHLVTRTYPLLHVVRGRDEEVGSLEVVASLDNVYRRIVRHAASIVVGNGLKTFLVALFMVSLFRRVVTSRLEALAREVRALAPKTLTDGRISDRAPMPEHLDELDAVRWGLDHTAKDLAEAIGALERLNAELEARVEARTQELEATNKDLEAFSYTLSHDLRAPLRTLGAYAQILKEDYGARLEAEGEQHIERMVAATARMDELVADTLGFFRASARRPERRSVDVTAAAQTIAENLARNAPDRRAAWTIAPGMAAVADPGLLRTVLENLIGNAWKYSSKRERSEIAVGTFTRTDGETAFFVKDNGAGFDMAYASRLFVPFQRLHGEEEFPGTGVGLATVQKIVHRHGGEIWAEAAPEQGATFYFTLPPVR